MTPDFTKLSVAGIIAVLLPIVIPFLTDWVTKSSASAGLKRTVTLVLAAVAGAVQTVVLTDGEDWQAYVVAIFYSAALAFLTHSTGITDGVQRATADIGIGGSAGTTPAPPNTDDGTGHGVTSGNYAPRFIGDTGPDR